ncbi:hypothetical protein ABPG74_017164 [Tetrahymena malaccensis]
MGQNKSKLESGKKSHLHYQVYQILDEFKEIEEKYFYYRKQAYMAHDPVNYSEYLEQDLDIIDETKFFIEQIERFPSIELISAFVKYLDFIYRSYEQFKQVQQQLQVVQNKLHFIQLDLNNTQNFQGISQLVKDKFSYVQSLSFQIHQQKQSSLRTKINLLKNILNTLQYQYQEETLNGYMNCLEDISTHYSSEMLALSEVDSLRQH